MIAARENQLTPRARATVRNRTVWLDKQCRRIASDTAEIRIRHMRAAERCRALRVKYL